MCDSEEGPYSEVPSCPRGAWTPRRLLPPEFGRRSLPRPSLPWAKARCPWCWCRRWKLPHKQNSPEVNWSPGTQHSRWEKEKESHPGFVKEKERQITKHISSLLQLQLINVKFRASNEFLKLLGLVMGLIVGHIIPHLLISVGYCSSCLINLAAVCHCDCRLQSLTWNTKRQK